MIDDDEGGPSEGTTSLRMRLLKNGRSDLLNSATTGGLNIFSMDKSTTPPIQLMSDITKDIVKSADVIQRNNASSSSSGKAPLNQYMDSLIDFIDISDEDD